MKILEKISWQDIALILIIIIYLVSQYNLISSFQQLPAPLYGGDRYNQLGAVIHVRDGGDPFKSYATSDPLPSYLPVYSIIVGNYARAFDLSGMDAMFSFSYIITILGLIIIYWFGKTLFNNKSAALGGTILFFNLTRLPIIKYRQFTEVTLFPLFFICLYYTIKNRDWKWALATGITFGVGSLAHGSMFLYLLLFMPILFFYMFFGQYLDYKKRKFYFRKKEFLSSWKKNLFLFLIIFIIGFIISLVYWGLPFKYMFSGDPELREIIDLSRAQGRPDSYDIITQRAGYVLTTLWNQFIAYSPVFIIFTILGVSLFLLLRKWTEYTKFIILICISTILIFWHFLITKPLLGAQVPTDEMTTFILPLIMFMFTGFFILILNKKLKGNLKFGINIILIIIFLLSNFIIFNNYVDNDKWINAGKSPLPEPLVKASEYILKTTDVNDVFITNHEVGFALNGLTGRKLVSTPRGSHNTAIADLTTRDAHLAVILYGKNDTERERLFKEYDVKYLFWYAYWLRGEFIFNEKGEPVGLFDPILILDKPEWREYLSNNNVTYQPIFAELNPNKRGVAKKFNVLLVIPQMDIAHPWDNSLDKYLTIEYEYPEDEAQAIVYKVNY